MKHFVHQDSTTGIAELMMEAIDLHNSGTNISKEAYFKKLSVLKQQGDITEEVRIRCINMMQCGS